MGEISEEVIVALRTIRAEALRMEKEDYRVVSMRGLAVRLGLADQTDAILAACAENGWEYCLDSAIECNSGIPNSKERIHPPHSACMWGPDQLRSRLDCVDYRVYDRNWRPSGA